MQDLSVKTPIQVTCAKHMGTMDKLCHGLHRVPTCSYACKFKLKKTSQVSSIPLKSAGFEGDSLYRGTMVLTSLSPMSLCLQNSSNRAKVKNPINDYAPDSAHITGNQPMTDKLPVEITYFTVLITHQCKS